MSKYRITFAHHLNPSFARNAALALAEVKLLDRVITAVAYNPESSIWNILNLLPQSLKNTIRNELSRRTWKDVPITTYPWQEIIRIFLIRTNIASYLRLKDKQLIEWVYVGLDKKIARYHLDNIDAIYSYEDLAYTTFKKAKEKGIICLYDLPIPYYQMTRRIMAEEAEIFPEFASSIDTINEPEWKIKRKQEEVKLADHILVASSVTKRSLLEIGIKPEKITVIPYGAPIDEFKPETKKDEIFRALYVGRVSPRKGVQYLMKAWQELNLKDAQLQLIGANLFPKGWLEQYQGFYNHIPSVSHFILNQYYTQGSVLVFPSLVEGFGLVILEAMACGIPVITTPNTGGVDIITDGVEGFIIPIRDVEALKEKLDWCYQNPEKLAEMGKAARLKAEALNWGVYRQKLAAKVQEILSDRLKQ
jgi:alpha-maltose-1-phosphate synthase